MEFNEILLLGLVEPDHARLEFWEKAQKESGDSPESFWNKLNDSWEHYYNQIETQINEWKRWGNEVSDCKLPLMIITGGKIRGELGLSEIGLLHNNLIELGERLKIYTYYYAYTRPNIITTNAMSPRRQFKLYQNLNRLSFENELAGKALEKIAGFLDFHFESFRIMNGDVVKWIRQTKKLLPAEFTPQQKLAFLSWFENIDNVDPNKNSNFFQNNAEKKFDLTRYSLDSDTVIPYFRIIKIQNHYKVYDGAIGNNRFQYFKITANSKAGSLCKDFCEKRTPGSVDTGNIAEEHSMLIEACNLEASEREMGLPAYLKFWNDCVSEDEKTNYGFYIIQHVEALKEWYSLCLQKHVNENEKRYLSQSVKDADIQNFKNEIAKSVDLYIKSSEIKASRQKSLISSLHAEQLIEFHKWLDEQKNGVQTKTKAEDLQCDLEKYGFFELPMVKSLTTYKKRELIQLLSLNDLPYCIAMFDFLGFLKHLESGHFQTKDRMNKEISRWFGSDKQGRAVKGNISTLSEYSKEDKKKYTAHSHKELVENDYKKLK